VYLSVIDENKLVEGFVMAIVTVADVKGGTGKTTTVINLLHALGLDEVVHLDKHGGLLRMNELRVNPFACIHAPKSEKELLELLSTDTKDRIMLVDCGGYDDMLGRLAIANADLVIVPSNDNSLEQFGVVDTSAIMKEISVGLGREIVGHALLNRVHHAKRLFGGYDSLLEELGNLVRIPVVIPHSTKVSDAMAEGMALTSGSVPCRYQQVAKYIKAQLISTGALNHE
jgi:chromosome partitioning protein